MPRWGCRRVVATRSPLMAPSPRRSPRHLPLSAPPSGAFTLHRPIIDLWAVICHTNPRQQLLEAIMPQPTKYVLERNLPDDLYKGREVYAYEGTPPFDTISPLTQMAVTLAPGDTTYHVVPIDALSFLR